MYSDYYAICAYTFANSIPLGIHYAYRAAQDIYNMMWSVKCKITKLPTIEMITEIIESYHNEDMKLDDNEQIA